MKQLLVLAAVMVAGCGNYSNEDLEFMNALPADDALRIEIPARSAAISPVDEAELARTTHNTTRDLNGLTAGLLAIVDYVRSHPPTSRSTGSRTWGPYPGDWKNPNFQTRMIMTRSLMVEDRFDYEISVHKVGTADTAWPVYIRGWFHVTETARRGTGHIEVVTADVRAAGLNVDDWKMLDHLEIDYDTVDDPIWIRMNVTSLPDPLAPDEPVRLTYEYNATLAGQGQMTFDLYGDFIKLTPAVEHMNVTSRWRANGEGAATLTVIEGDGKGLVQKECWDSMFLPTFNDKPFMPLENRGMDPSVCPDIPAL